MRLWDFPEDKVEHCGEKKNNSSDFCNSPLVLNINFKGTELVVDVIVYVAQIVTDDTTTLANNFGRNQHLLLLSINFEHGEKTHTYIKPSQKEKRKQIKKEKKKQD